MTDQQRRVAVPVVIAVVAAVVAVLAAVFTPARPDDTERVAAATAAQLAVEAVGSVAQGDVAGDPGDYLGGALAADFAGRGPVAIFGNVSDLPVETTVTGAATAEIADGRAKVLLFIDQSAPDGPRLALTRWATMVREGDHWVMTRLEPVNGQ